MLGALLLIDGIGKIPLVISGIQDEIPALIPLLLSALIPVVLGVLLLVNPFHAAQLVIMVFGIALIGDGISDLVTALISRKPRPIPVSDADAPHEP